MLMLSAQQILEIWERGEDLHPIDKAMTLLSTAFPEKTSEELAKLSIGERDALLFAIRELVFGPRLEIFCECPACGTYLELSLTTSDLLAGNRHHPDSELHLEAEGFHVLFRLPNSIDLAECAGLSKAEGRRKLMEQCILRASREDAEIDPEALPEMVTSALTSRMKECDPMAEVQLSMLCPSCAQQWSTVLDIVTFFWTEIDTEARNLLRQVHIIARSYGWRESDILSLDASRRQRYVDMVMS